MTQEQMQQAIQEWSELPQVVREYILLDATFALAECANNDSTHSWHLRLALVADALIDDATMAEELISKKNSKLPLSG